MTKSQRKGATAELEVLAILRDALGIRLTRNPRQAAVGGRDLIEDEDQPAVPFAIEVKRQERSELNAWWAQTVKQAQACDRMPVLFYRANRQPWRIAVDPHDINAAIWPNRGFAPAIFKLEAGLQVLQHFSVLYTPSK
jgi:hypothetical protein